ncbi:MAG: peroxidase family protein [Cyanobacteria bacterium P01_A01_bin.84]
MSIIKNNPFLKGRLNLRDRGFSTRRINGSRNNLRQRKWGKTGSAFTRLTPIEYEDGISSPAGVSKNAEGEPLIGVNGLPVMRQGIPIFSKTEKERLISNGLEVVENKESLSNQPDAPFVLLNPKDRPSARVISNATSNLKKGETNPSSNGLSSLNWTFGQFVSHDINLAGVLKENNFNIDIPKDDPNFPINTPPLPTIKRQKDGGLEFEFPRDKFMKGTGKSKPAKTPNELTHWLDLSSVYGSTKKIHNAVRAYKGGLLKVFPNETKATNDDLLPADTSKLMRGGFFQGVGFLAGDDRVSEQDALVVQHTVWVRNHNRLAEALSEEHPKWSDNQIFQRARQINIAQYQKVVMDEWLPQQIGNVIESYQRYKPKTNPQISDEFNAAGFRFGHSQTGNKVQAIDKDGNTRDIPLLASFGAPNVNKGSDVDGILRGDIRTLDDEVDTNVVFDLRNALFPPAGVGFDLYAANIQRGRDRGLADYNQVRDSLGLGRVKSFNEITSDPKLAETLEKLYGTVEDVDLLIGLFAEDATAPSGMGKTAQQIVGEQFERLRDGDRFWYERPDFKGGFFTKKEIQEIKQTTYADIIKLNTEIDHLQKDVFLVPTKDNSFDDGLLSTKGKSGRAKITLTGEKGGNNSVGFYKVIDDKGTVVDPLNGNKLTPEDGEKYTQAAIANSVAEFAVKDNIPKQHLRVKLPSDSLLAPYIIPDGNQSDFNSGNMTPLFGLGSANKDRNHNVLELGNGNSKNISFAFESMTGAKSDRDFNDVTMKISLA